MSTTGMDGIRIRQIYHLDQHEPNLDSGFIPYRNRNSNYFLESQAIADLHQCRDHAGSLYYGTLSHKFRNKTGIGSREVFDVLRADRLNHLVYSYYSENSVRHAWTRKNMWIRGDSWHPGISRIATSLFDKMHVAFDAQDPEIKMDIIYSNYWIAEAGIFNDFCERFLHPAMRLLRSDSQLHSMCMRDSGYWKPENYSPQQCQELFGVPFYPYFPFVCERLFSTYCYVHRISVHHIL